MVLYLVEQLPHCDLLRLIHQTERFVCRLASLSIKSVMDIFFFFLLPWLWVGWLPKTWAQLAFKQYMSGKTWQDMTNTLSSVARHSLWLRPLIFCLKVQTKACWDLSSFVWKYRQRHAKTFHLLSESTRHGKTWLIPFLESYASLFNCHSSMGECLRPYHVENTSSRLIPEVKQRRAASVLGWVTAWEYAVL